MGLTALMVAVVVLFILSGCLLFWFGNWFKHRMIVTVSVLISWYFSFIIVVVVPADVSSTVYRQCLHDEMALHPGNGSFVPTPVIANFSEHGNVSNIDVIADMNHSSTLGPEIPFVTNCTKPWSFVPDSVLQNLWRVVYWTSQVLTWLIFPMMQSYSKAGDFTFFGKFKSALIDNAIYYGSYLILAISFIIYLAGTGTPLDWPKLKAIAATASNTWGLTLLILLLGYGLVEVPRTLWLRSHRGYVLEHAYFEASKLAVEKSEAEEEVEDIVRILKSISSQIPPGDRLYPHLMTIRAKLPEVFDSVFAANSGTVARMSPSTGYDQPTEKVLIRLHKQLIRALQAERRTRTQWEVLVDGVAFDEDVARNEASLDKNFKRTVTSVGSKGTFDRYLKRIYTPKIEWYWHCIFKRQLMKVLAALCAAWTIMVLWSEVTFFAENPTLSLFAIFLNLAKQTHDFFSVELVSFFTIVYLCICTYFTIFKIRILNLYYLAPHHMTDEYSLLFSGMLLCRLTPPLCLNFLSLVHLDSHITKSANIVETSYTHIMGHMDVIDFISDYFNIYFPIGVVLLCAATWLSLGARILSFLGFQQFMVEADVTSDLVQEGQELIRREKRKRKPQEPKAEPNRDRTTRSLFPGRNSSSTGRIMERQGSSSRLQLIPNSESMDYTSFGEPVGLGSRIVDSPEPPVPFNSSTTAPRRGIFDDV